MTIYNDPFLISDWQTSGSDFLFNGTDIAGNPAGSAPNEQYAWFHAVPFAELELSMVFDFQTSLSASFSNIVPLSGIFVYPLGANPALPPISNSNGYMGAGAYWGQNCFAPTNDIFIGYDGFLADYFGSCVTDSNTRYNDNRIDITLSVDNGGNQYDVTTRLRVPGLGVDETRTRPNYFTGTANGRICLSGSHLGNFGTAYFKVRALQIETTEIPPVPPMTPARRAAILSGAGGNLTAKPTRFEFN